MNLAKPINAGGKLELMSPAKINLFLIVNRRRKDGYHDLTTLMCPIGLADKIMIMFDVTESRVICGSKGVPEDETNLAYKALSLFSDALGVTVRAEIRIVKNIPVAAGLGGGSSNAAAVLKGLNGYFGGPFNMDQLMDMAVRLGADVPFFLFSGPALARGIGEKLMEYRNLSSFPILIICPEIFVSTADVFKNLNLRLTNCKKKLKSFSFNHKFNPAHHLCNDLETVTIRMYPEIAEIKDALKEVGAKGVLMSGSGPAVFGVFSDQDSISRAESKFSKTWTVIRSEVVVQDTR